MNQTNKKKLERVIEELENLKTNSIKPPQKLDKELLKNIRSAEDIEKIRDILNADLINEEAKQKLENLKDIIDDMQFTYEDKTIDLDFENPRYDSYESISSDLDSAKDDLEEALDAIDDYENEDINDKLDDVEEALDELNSAIRDLEYEIEMQAVNSNPDLDHYIDSAISSIQSAMLS